MFVPLGMSPEKMTIKGIYVEIIRNSDSSLRERGLPEGPIRAHK